MAFAALSPNVSSAASTWNGGGGNVNWSTAGNWTGGTPTSSATTDLIFAGTINTGTAGTPLNQNIAVPMVFRSITFDATAGNFFLGGSGLAYSGGNNISITQSSSNSQSIANTIAFTGSNANTTLTLTGNGTGVVTLSGAISESNGQRLLGIAKTGTSAFVLSGANTYSLGTTVSAGTLFVNNTSGSGTGTGAVTVNTSGTLGGSGTISGAVTLNNSATINGGGTAGAIGTLTTGALTLNNTSVLSVDMTATTADKIGVIGTISLATTSVLNLIYPSAQSSPVVRRSRCSTTTWPTRFQERSPTPQPAPI